jgi:hypothetical protein
MESYVAKKNAEISHDMGNYSPLSEQRKTN